MVQSSIVKNTVGIEAPGRQKRRSGWYQITPLRPPRSRARPWQRGNHQWGGLCIGARRWPTLSSALILSVAAERIGRDLTESES